VNREIASSTCSDGVVLLLIQYDHPPWVDPWCHGEGVLSADQRDELRHIASELASIARSGEVLAGSIAERRTHCGRSGCKCMADPPEPHGPYFQWTRKLDHKTVGKWLSPEQGKDYRAWITNRKRIRELTSRLEAIGESALDQDPRGNR
jgi:hypothetical protein